MNILMYLNVKSFLIELLIINAICSAILVIISKNPVISVIFLISLVLNSALFLMVKGMPFLGISYILIYLGAIIVLFLFVIMMINIKLTDILETGYQYTKNIPLALIVSGLFIYEFFNILPSYLNSTVIPNYQVSDNSILLSIVKGIVLTLNSLISSSTYFLGFGSSENSLILSDASHRNLTSIWNTEASSITLEQAACAINHSSAHSILSPVAHQHSSWLGALNDKEILPFIINNNWPETLISSYTQIVSVAYGLYTYGAFLFLLLGFILLLAMIAPIYLSRN